MGQSLSSPIIDKTINYGETEAISYGVVEMQGWRPSMEDAHCVSLNFSSEHDDWNLFAIFDGHAGAEASKYCSNNLNSHVSRIYKQLEDKTIELEESPEYNGFSSDLPPEIQKLAVSLHDGFIELDEEMRTDPNYKDDPISCGTTALALITTPEYLIFSNCGDSRAIFSRDNKLFFETKDHKPSDESEKERIVGAGSVVCIERVNGNLAVSRALGDYSFKGNTDLPLIKQAVSPEPTITIIPRQSGDQFVVLACDGIWDVLSSQEVNDMVLNRLKVTHSLQDISSMFIDAALYLDSRDNMTFMLILLPGAPEINPHKVEKDEKLNEQITVAIERMLSCGEFSLGSNAIIRKLNTEFSETKKTVINYKIPFILDLMNKLCPSRDKSKDFPSSIGIRCISQNMHTIQSVMSRYGLGAAIENDDD